MLDRAAAAAQAEAPTTLGPGQYFYSDVHELETSFWAFGSNDPAEDAYTDQEQTLQTWVGADGSANQVTTYDGPQQFVTSASRAGWLLAGSPFDRSTKYAERGSTTSQAAAVSPPG